MRNCDYAKENASKIILRMREIIEFRNSVQASPNEHRIWGLENDEIVGEMAKKMFSESFDEAKKYYKTGRLKYTIMGNIVKKGSTGSGGGWHQDSQLSRQYKAICYLSLVEEEGDGAFQHFNCFQTIVLSATSKLFFDYSNRIKSNIIKSVGFNPATITGEVGTIFSLDTRLVHRGAPVKNEERERIAVTLYIYSEKKYPKEIVLSDLK
jgi:hypothetical protein